MEPSLVPASAYVLSLVLVPLSIYLLSALLNRNTKSLPPGTRGWPMLGETMAYAFSSTHKFVNDRLEKYSPADVIQTSLYGERVAVFSGAQGNKFLFTNENKLVSVWFPRSTTKLLFLPESHDMSSEKQVSPSNPSFYSDILKPEVLKQYLPVMDAVARQHMARDWTPNNVVKVLPLSGMYTMELACRLFLRVVDHQQIKELADSFALMNSGMYSVPIDFPGTTYNHAIKAGISVREKIMRIIKERRKELMETKPNEGRDLLSKMLLVTNMSEITICNFIIGLIVATFTTASALTSVINYLASLPQIYEEVLREQMEIAKGKGVDELLTWKDTEKMKLSWNVGRETLRLMPPGQGAFREIVTEFTYAGFTIPKGWKAFWSVHSHKNPKYFPEPEKFDPSRFEGNGPAPYTFVPFGGGSRMCPGKEFARLAILVFMHNLVTRFRFEKVFPHEKIVFKHAKHSPVHGLPVRLHPHAK